MADDTKAAAGAANQTVMIACKHPSGVILNLDRYVPNGINGQVRRENGKFTVTLKGWAHAFGTPDPAADAGGYVLTPVPKDFWDQWIGTHADFPMVTDKTILGPHQDARGKARAHNTVPKMYRMAERDEDALRKAHMPHEGA